MGCRHKDSASASVAPLMTISRRRLTANRYTACLDFSDKKPQKEKCPQCTPYFWVFSTSYWVIWVENVFNSIHHVLFCFVLFC